MAGDYVKGAQILSELFVESKNADFIYNQGRCFEQNRRCEEAVARFEEYLRVQKKLSKGEKADVQKHISGCQAVLTKQTQAAEAVKMSPGAAGSKESRERAAKKACLTGDASAGVAILTDLYLDTNDTTYLFNQGRCFEQNRHYEDAIGRFREYLEKAKNLRAEDKADTRRHIANCESYLRERPGEPSKPESASMPAEKPPVVNSKPPMDEPRTAEGLAVPTAPAANPSGGALRVAGGIVVGLGLASIATGVVLNLKANGMTHDLEADWSSGTNSSRQSYETAAWIGYGAGAACVVAGVVMYYLGWRRRSVSLAAVPAVAADMAGTVLVGAF